VFSLENHRALLVGGAGGLGSAIAEAFAAQGAAVAIADRRGDAARTSAATLTERHPDRRIIGVEMDVTDEPSVIRAVADVAENIGPPDIVVAAAGIGVVRPISEMSYAEWREMLAVHLDGTFLTIRHTIGPMLDEGWGRIICFSSIASLQGVAGQAHYAAGKGGVDGLVRSFSREVADRGVTVNAIAPGYFESPLNDIASTERLEALVANVPVGRFGRPDEIGALAVYLASNEAAYTTGQIISPNGGFAYCRHLEDERHRR
jgi:NAD(P)-dependent dehydrogenase (short-subunit alcohol dehydrogenase family)